MIRISYPLFSEPYLLEIHKMNFIVIENQKAFYDFVIHLLSTLDKDDSPLIILNDYERISNIDVVDFIPNLFDININSKKNISHLHKNIIRLINDDFFEFSTHYHSLMKTFSNTIFNFDSSLTYNCDFDPALIVKLFNPTFDLQYDNLLELLINYINVMIEFSNLKLLILLNLQDFLSEVDINQLFKHCEMKEVTLLSIQAKHYRNHNHNCYIIDNDLCEILA